MGRKKKKKDDDDDEMDELGAILRDMEEPEDADFDVPVFLPGELQGTDEEIMNMNLQELKGEDAQEDMNWDDDEFDGDPLLMGADGKPFSDDQLKLLYTISRYSHKARTAEESEKWVRKVQLLVLIYEGVISKAFNYDYAPQVQQIECRHVYMNISQEGKDDIDDLRESYLIAAARVTSKDGQAITAYQLTEKGYDALARVPEDLCKEIDDFIDTQHTGRLIEAVWDGEFFRMRPEGSRSVEGRISTVTETEDVSYVCSPYIPSCVRVRGRDCISNAGRAHEAALGGADVNDEFDEAVFLDEVSILVGEWIPYGMNQLVMLNDKLGSTERVQGGLFTAETDAASTDTSLDVGTGLTNVVILDYDEPAFVNIEAEIMYPEEDNIVQVECFGIHIRLDGTLLYGLHVEAIMDRIKNGMSLDSLARVLVDVAQDSSRIVDSVLSRYQQALLDMVFLGDYSNRPKVNVILCERIRPWLPAERYMDKEDNENELKQVLGDTDSAHQLSEEQVMIVGKMGILIGGKGCKDHEELMIAYASLASRDLYLRTFFSRCLIMEDTMRVVRQEVNTYEQDPGSIHRIRDKIAKISKDAILLNETLLYMHESMEEMEDFEEPSQDDEAAYNLHYLLNIGGMLHDLKARARDVEKNVHGIHHELKGLREITTVISEGQMFKMQESMAANTSSLEAVFRANERTSASLEVMQVVLAGTLAFQIIDRILGGWTILATDWGKKYVKEMLLDVVGVWFMISIGLWLVLAYGLTSFMAKLKRRAVGIIGHKRKIDQPLDLEAYRKFMKTRRLEDEDIDVDGPEKYKKVSWREPWSLTWRGEAPQVEVTIDETNGYLVKYFIQYNKNKGSLRGHEVSERFLKILQDNGLIPAPPKPRNPRPSDAPIIKFEKTEVQEFDVDSPVETKLSFLNED